MGPHEPAVGRDGSSESNAEQREYFKVVRLRTPGLVMLPRVFNKGYRNSYDRGEVSERMVDGVESRRRDGLTLHARSNDTLYRTLGRMHTCPQNVFCSR